MDALMIKRAAAREAMGFTAQGMTDQMEGQMAAQAGRLSALSTLLNAGSQMWLESDPNYIGYRGRGVGMG